ncbi:MAG TPA: prephenate dehydrogenase/arogenate dehydrogenase family protein [Anaerolineales bacterium]|nr:prephenate dehydrogenase/arogenate dehydrogenase family protein [Anaerolineales bacterium]
MSIQITIIGLGQVGTSIGLALAEQKSIKRVGHDKDYETARAAQKVGAVDETKINLPASVLDANIVLLCLPLSEIRETLKFISDDLQEGTVILDTAPAKAKVAAWVNELIPHGRYYVGLSPAAGVNYLHGIDLGVEAARRDLFDNGLFLVNAPSGTPGEAVKLATDLIELLGAQVMFTDPIEADGLLASTHLLPQLAAAALLDATVDQPGWVEARKVAARPYATATAALAYHDEAQSLGEAALGNRESVLRVLDAYMSSLQRLRDDIDRGDDHSVAEFLEDAVKAHDRWLHERTRADWQNPGTETDSTRFGERVNQMLFGGLMNRNKKRK